jgi:hypothetical protein
MQHAALSNRHDALYIFLNTIFISVILLLYVCVTSLLLALLAACGFGFNDDNRLRLSLITAGLKSEEKHHGGWLAT